MGSQCRILKCVGVVKEKKINKTGSAFRYIELYNLAFISSLEFNI